RKKVPTRDEQTTGATAGFDARLRGGGRRVRGLHCGRGGGGILENQLAIKDPAMTAQTQRDNVNVPRRDFISASAIAAAAAAGTAMLPASEAPAQVNSAQVNSAQ